MSSQSDQFNIRWNDHQHTIQQVFRKLLDGEQFVDVTLACEGKSIKCHRMVLSACSVYFEKLLTDNPFPHLVIYIKDMKYAELSALVTFMYQGEVSVNQNKLHGLVKAAESLKIKGLAPDASLPDDSERIDEDDIEEMVDIGAKHGHEDSKRSSLLRFSHQQQFPKHQLKRKVMVAQPPKLVKMQKMDRHTNGSVGMKSEQEFHPASDDEESSSFPHETNEEMSINHEDQDEDVEENLEISLNPDGSGHSSASEGEVEEPEPHIPPPGRSRFAYSKEIRDSALAALSSGMSLRQCSEAFGIPRKTLSKWKNNREQLPAEDYVEQDEDGRRQAISMIPQAGAQDGADRAERLQKAMELAVSGVTVRQAAAHFDIPRTTLCAYMKRRGIAPKRNFLPGSGQSRKIGLGSAAKANTFEDSLWGDSMGLGQMMDEYNNLQDQEEDQK